MNWDIELLKEFEEWWLELSEPEHISIRAAINLLKEFGPSLPRPYSDTLNGSKYTNMKELMVQHKGKPYRIIYIFDPRRIAILILGGDKTGNKDWYDNMIKKADKLYAQHLKEIGG